MIENNKLYFFTSTILNWQHLLKPDKYKDIIINSLKYLIQNKKIRLFAFVIMPNHIHLVWKAEDKYRYSDIIRDFKKFTAQAIKLDLKTHHPMVLERFKTNGRDREYQIWERESLSIELISTHVCEQKINYIHANPLSFKWKLAINPQDYKYSSAKFYYDNIDEFGILENYMNL